MYFCVMMPSENLVVRPSEILCNIGYLLSKMITNGSEMSKEQEYRQSIVSRVLAVYLAEVEAKVWEVLAHIAQADTEFFSYCVIRAKWVDSQCSWKTIN